MAENDLNRIRNFSIIAHIDHGKSTLADRMLEITNTIPERKMQAQVLDSMELEREKGITIKMRPVRMQHEGYILNLIDTPGHIDFFYEVSRALKAVEGSILLIDSTQGVQAQTLTTLQMAKESGLAIIPVLSKIDSPIARIKEVKEEICQLLNCQMEDIMETSGKTGQGVSELLAEIIKKVPSPVSEMGSGALFSKLSDKRAPDPISALVFDFQYSNHKGVIVYVRVFDGMIQKNMPLTFRIANEKFNSIEVGVFTPDEEARDGIGSGEIGYIVTGIKKPGIASVGDTVTTFKNPALALPGYMSPSPVVWASIYPEDADDFELLKQALGKLRLSDSSFTYEEESSGSLGRGFRCGFLGLLHLEIITERLKREFRLDLVIATPSITYEVVIKSPQIGQPGKKVIIYSPSLFPENNQIEAVYEPWIKLKIITPASYVGSLLQLLYEHEGEVGDTHSIASNTHLNVKMPLRELMRNFFDELKSISSGFASLSYEFDDMRPAEVTRLDILVADEPVEAFTRVVSLRRVQEEAEKAVTRLFNVLPRQMFTTKIQGKALGRILASETLSAMKKDVTQHMYGGDITRKMKLREKQKKGKKKMKARGKVNIPHETFLKMMKN